MNARTFLGAVGAALFCLSALAQTTASSSGLDLSAIDKSVSPCQDFYQYACGNWVKTHPVPAQEARWGRFNELSDRNEEILHSILEDSAKHQDRSAIDQKIGAFYAACMNERAIDRAGDDPLKADLDNIKAIRDLSGIPSVVARLHNQRIAALFGFRAAADPDDARVNIADADQGGLGLPDKDFYTRKDPKSEETRRRYVEHIAAVFELIGEDSNMAGVKARAVMAFETNLASGSLRRVERRDPTRLHHKMSVSEFLSLAPDFNFNLYFSVRQAPQFTSLNVDVPDFFKNLGRLLTSTPLEDLKSYLTFHVVSSYAPDLSKKFVDANFDFYARYMTGALEIKPRWKRCVEDTDSNLGEALGQKFVEVAFAGASKQKTQQLVAVIEQQMETDIKSLTWMSDATKQNALAKLHTVTNKIGYPDRWRDYSSVDIVPTQFVGDVRRCREFESHRNISKIGRPVDRSEFGMTPPTVNAYYRPEENNINFPAGILQPPFYSPSADPAVNFGAIGSVIGHELTHGFDDQGRQFDAGGNLRDWWTQQDAAEFKQRADCIANEYSGFSPVEGVHLDGRLTLGENGADNAGVRLAFMALLGGIENGTINKQELDAYTPQQRFFLGYAQLWCQNTRPEESLRRAQIDPHSPGRFRVDGVVENMPEFSSAFGCTAGQPMTAAANACRVW